MKWASDDTNPGLIAYVWDIGDRLYRIQAKEGRGVWRLFVRDSPDEPLRTIYVDDNLEGCKKYADAYAELNP